MDPRLGRLALAAGLGLCALDVALEVARIAGCESIATSVCLGSVSDHLLLLAGGLLVVGAYGPALAGAGRPLRPRDLPWLFAISLVAVVAVFLADGPLESRGGIWDGRELPIELVFLLALPVLAALGYCAARRVGRGGTALAVVATPVVGAVTAFVAVLVLVFAFPDGS